MNNLLKIYLSKDYATNADFISLNGIFIISILILLIIINIFDMRFISNIFFYLCSNISRTESTIIITIGISGLNQIKFLKEI